ncbi:hypothetical protein GQ607_015149 [Colletotrichum asianum]|uniref:Uncharacterized protein n=1 Tax=Colletotrichum asianum TaxID=702518 RepID=A0A8H3W183_9PEZI|nr:hypothetical protein GQ607_015149 [Colletotrichum asianum]
MCDLVDTALCLPVRFILPPDPASDHLLALLPSLPSADLLARRPLRQPFSLDDSEDLLPSIPSQHRLQILRPRSPLCSNQRGCLG